MSTAFSPTAARSLGGPDWLVARRTAAAEAFAATERPDDAAEEWRYSLIGQFDLDEACRRHTPSIDGFKVVMDRQTCEVERAFKTLGQLHFDTEIV